MRIAADLLTQEAFAPFGTVLSVPLTPGWDRIHDAVQNLRDTAKLNLAVGLAEPKAFPLHSNKMERHRYSSQTFVPMDAESWLVMVAPDAPDGRPDMHNARAFLANANQIVTYNKDVWHHPAIVFNRPARFTVLTWKDDSADDVELVDVPSFEVTS
ncbi:ureidoglycolate lyase [Agrobacterium sp. LAD9]|uniref:ureidoglycolate lyase n=1 Tax=Agrobacterium sp. LAD9 TaxID=2055153 RepID=UPI000D1D8A27|nr:ureidoglycolate lyase [Agrobacterium sp. LAD9]